MKRAFLFSAFAISLLSMLLLALYFVSVPDLRKTAKRAWDFYKAAERGGEIADVLRASPRFTEIVFGNCGRLAESPDSGPKGSLIFSPAEGPFARYSSVEEFLRLNATLISQHEECRKVTVLYRTIFPYSGEVEVGLDKSGAILTVKDPQFFI
jgi:hypothetical protein